MGADLIIGGVATLVCVALLLGWMYHEVRLVGTPKRASHPDPEAEE